MTGMVHIFMVAEMIGGKVGDRMNNMHAYYFSCGIQRNIL